MNKKINIYSLVALLYALTFVGCNQKTESQTSENSSAEQSKKPRVVLMHDIGGDPDDEQSLVRFLAYSNEFDIEAITMVDLVRAFVDSTQQEWTRNRHNEIISAYAKAYPNFTKHADGYLSEDELQSITHMGNYGLRFSNRPGYPEPFWEWVGDGVTPLGDPKDSPGSNAIVAALEKDDDRPLYVMMWGGAYTLVQALWRYQEKHPDDDFSDRLIVHNIMWQDVTHDYFRDLSKAGKIGRRHYRGTYDGERSNKHVIVDNFHYGWYRNNGTTLDKDDYEQDQFEQAWADEHIRSHGPLGAEYPTAGHRLGTREGDTPAILYVLSQIKGLSDMKNPAMGGWGGRYALSKELGPQYYTNTLAGINDLTEEDLKDHHDGYSDKAMAFARWRRDVQNDFQARMDWAITSNYEEANHNPIAVLNGDDSNEIFRIDAMMEQEIKLDASESYDPDKDELSYEWFRYPEADSYSGEFQVDSKDAKLTFTVPGDLNEGENIHIILRVKDNGTPSMVDYKRIVLTNQ